MNISLVVDNNPQSFMDVLMMMCGNLSISFVFKPLDSSDHDLIFVK